MYPTGINIKIDLWNKLPKINRIVNQNILLSTYNFSAHIAKTIDIACLMVLKLFKYNNKRYVNNINHPYFGNPRNKAAVIINESIAISHWESASKNFKNLLI